METDALVNLLYVAAGRVRSLAAEYRDWSKPLVPRTLKVDVNLEEKGGGRWIDGSPYPVEVTTERRLWLKSPHQLRVEIERRGELVVSAVRDGSAWWLWRGNGGDNGGGTDAMPSVLRPVLIAPQMLLSTVWLDVIEERSRAGRPAIVARGVPRDPDGAAQTFDFEFDREYGTILRRAVFVNGVCTNATEAVRAFHNVEIDPKVFEFAKQQPPRD